MMRGILLSAAWLASAVILGDVAAAAVPPPAANAVQARSAAASWPSRGRIVFRITRGDPGLLVGRVSNEWHHDRNAYTLTSVTETAGVVALFSSAKTTQTSEGMLVGTVLAPREYRAERRGRIDTASFDWSTGRLRISGGTPAELPLPPGTQDVLSLFYQLGRLPGRGAGQEVAVTTGRKLERYAFERVGEESLTLPFGVRRTLHIKTRTAPDGEATEVWVGLDRESLPLKIRYVDRKGDTYAQTADVVDVGAGSD